MSNLLPRTTGSIYRHLRAGEVVQAQRAFAAIRPLTNALFETTNPIPVKSAAALLGWCEDRFRLPLVSLDAEATERLRAALDRCEELADPPVLARASGRMGAAIEGLLDARFEVSARLDADSDQAAYDARWLLRTWSSTSVAAAMDRLATPLSVPCRWCLARLG